MRYLNGNKTNRDVIAACDEVLRQYQAGDRTPTYNGVTFDGAAKMGHCQQNVRELVEAVAYGRERVWGEASCCATATNQRIRAQGYTSVDFSHALPGDLVYFGPGGGRCGTCHQDPGHVGIMHHQSGGTWYVWQNTSYESRGLCCIPLRDSQRSRIVGIYRVFPRADVQQVQAVDGERQINWWGRYLPAGDVMLQDGEHYVRLRAAAGAEDSAVMMDPVTGKVFVGPRSWWGEKAGQNAPG